MNFSFVPENQEQATDECVRGAASKVGKQERAAFCELV